MAFAGSGFRVEVLGDGGWIAVAGERSSAAKINNEQVDTTDKDGVPWRGLSPCGIRSAELTLAGVVRDDLDNATFGTLMAAAVSGDLIYARIYDQSYERIAEGLYQVSSMERTGEYNGAEVYSITFSSAETMGFSVDPLILFIDTTIPAFSPSTDFILPLNSAWTYNCVIDWGDGNLETVTNSHASFPKIQHTYTAGGQYEVKIRPLNNLAFPGISFSDYHHQSGAVSSDSDKVLEVRQWGGIKWQIMQGAFQGCANMVVTATDAPKTELVTTFDRAFADCRVMTWVPDFDTSNAVDITSIFNNCRALLALPNINTGNAVKANFAFTTCQALTVFPVLDLRKATNLQGAFQGLKVTSFPQLDLASVLNLNIAWADCPELLSFAAPLNTDKATNWSGAFRSCVKLADLPALDTRGCTNAGTMFQGMSLLTSLQPGDFSKVLGASGNGWFRDCAALANLPDFIMPVAASLNLQNCFRGCASLTPAAYGNWLVRLEAANPVSVGQLTLTPTKYPASAAAARAALVSRGWTITDGGPE